MEQKKTSSSRARMMDNIEVKNFVVQWRRTFKTGNTGFFFERGKSFEH